MSLQYKFKQVLLLNGHDKMWTRLSITSLKKHQQKHLYCIVLIKNESIVYQCLFCICVSMSTFVGKHFDTIQIQIHLF